MLFPVEEVHCATAKEIRRKQLSSMTKEAWDTDDEDGDQKLEEHTAENDVQRR